MLAVIDIDVTGQVGLGELGVAVGTATLAWFTARLASATYRLDVRNAARERKRRERQVRGIARLVDGELEVVQGSLESAIENENWSLYLTTPRGAWDRDGALIVETVAEDVALELVRLFSDLGEWAALVARHHQRFPAADGMPLDKPSNKETLSKLLAEAAQARTDLRTLAYPDARDLEDDPDQLDAYLRSLPWRDRLRRRLRRG